jgi:hypothetical protein
MHLRMGVPDRRRITRGLSDAPPRDELISRILGTYLEMPGLALRPQEAAPFFGLTASACSVVMDDLVRSGLLGKNTKDRYVKTR